MELLGGRGEQLWPYPGRIFAVGPAHTFADLADAINTAFARWDRAHLDLFTLADGSLVTDEHTGQELTSSAFAGIVRAYDIEKTKVARTVRQGEEFKFTFDLGDDWVHQCVVNEGKVDPVDVLGIRPKGPLAYWGWGSIPDQYGRRTMDDDGESALPPEPADWHPMVGHGWPPYEEFPLVDPAQVSAAVAAGDVEGYLDAVASKKIEHGFQQIAAGLPMLLEHRWDEGERVTVAVYNSLTRRGWVGDGELAQDLLARLRRAPLDGQELEVDLAGLAALETASGGEPAGSFLDLTNGEVHAETGDGGPDHPSETRRWIRLQAQPAEVLRQDMEDFVDGVSDHAVREDLEAAMQGGGALTRFGPATRANGLEAAWRLFSTDRAIGRARAALAQQGIRVR